MLRSVQGLLGYKIGATDGEIGHVKDFYFDDETWTVRYLIVETGGWLFGRKVLISPVAFQSPEWNERIFHVNLTKEQIKSSPDIDTEKPVSRQQEIDLNSHYSWPDYGFAGVTPTGAILPEMNPIDNPAEENIKPEGKISGDKHLRSCKHLLGYSVHASDEDAGKAADFLLSDTDWKIPFLIIKTGNWFDEKDVLTSVNLISSIVWEESKIYLNQTTESLKNSPEYNSIEPLNEEFEQNLYRYYPLL